MDAQRDEWTCFHFSQANPRGKRQGDVPALLRRVGCSVADLGDVEVLDLTWCSEVDEHGVWPSLTVYYARGE